MSGGGGNHRPPIDVGDIDLKATSPSRMRVDQKADALNPADANVSQYHPQGAMRAAVVHHVVTAFLVVMLFGIGTWAYLTFKGADLVDGGTNELKAPPFEVPAGDAQLERLRFALDVYFRIYEKYPPTLEALVDEGLLATSDLGHPPGSSLILYERLGDSYQLTIERTIVTTQETAAEGSDDAGDRPEKEGKEREAEEKDAK